jgi:deleted-in-malignant-brain-tumors protein 1
MADNIYVISFTEIDFRFVECLKRLIALILFVTDTRLVGGTDVYTGRVEVYYSGVWGTICDDGFDDVDADVICKQLGHQKGEARTSAYFGQGSGDIVMKNVQCQANEASLYECPKKDRSQSGWQCSHMEDSGVICTPSYSKYISLVFHYAHPFGNLN